MREITLDEVYQMAADAREAVWEKAEANGREPKIYLHWTGMHYGQFFDDYHINIDEDGSLHTSCDDFSETLEHTWLRNSGAIGIAMACCAGGGSRGLGDEPPTERQIEAMAQVIGKVAEALWLTIDKQHVLTHGEAANNEDGYEDAHDPYAWWNDSYGDGDTRGDLEYLGTDESPSYNPDATDGSRGGDVLRGKANWYVNEWKKAAEA